MYNLPFKILFALSAMFIVIACDDIIEKDLTDESLIVVTPPLNFSSQTSTVHFYWEAVEGSEVYRLQIAYPDFETPIQMVWDSTYTGVSADVNLSPGQYNWRMRAENFNSYTPFITGVLTVDSSASLQGYSPALIAPVNDDYTNQDSIQFSWESIPIANEYRFELIDIVTKQTTHIEITDAMSTTFMLPNEGNYQWSVQGLNDLSISNLSSRIINIDRTSPPVATNLEPVNDFDADNANVDFVWDTQIDQGVVQSARQFRFSISDSPSFQTFLFDTPLLMNIDSLNLTLELGTYYWRVESLDLAGNDSIFSNTHSIHITE